MEWSESRLVLLGTLVMLLFAVFIVLFIIDQKKIIRNKNTQIKILDQECRDEIQKLKKEVEDLKQRLTNQKN